MRLPYLAKEKTVAVDPALEKRRGSFLKCFKNHAEFSVMQPGQRHLHTFMQNMFVGGRNTDRKAKYILRIDKNFLILVINHTINQDLYLTQEELCILNCIMALAMICNFFPKL